MNKTAEINNVNRDKTIDPQKICIMCDDKCCGHCSYYDGKGYCSDGKPVRPTDWCKDFKWAK